MKKRKCGMADKSTERWDTVARAALARMRLAHKRGTGCYLSAEMIQCLALTFLGEAWEDVADE